MVLNQKRIHDTTFWLGISWEHCKVAAGGVISELTEKKKKQPSFSGFE